MRFHYELQETYIDDVIGREALFPIGDLRRGREWLTMRLTSYIPLAASSTIIKNTILAILADVTLAQRDYGFFKFKFISSMQKKFSYFVC